MVRQVSICSADRRGKPCILCVCVCVRSNVLSVRYFLFCHALSVIVLRCVFLFVFAVRNIAFDVAFLAASPRTGLIELVVALPLGPCLARRS